MLYQHPARLTFRGTHSRDRDFSKIPPSLAAYLNSQLRFAASEQYLPSSIGDPEPDPMFLGIPDLDPNPLVRGMDPAPAMDSDPSLFSLKVLSRLK
jgi:hypothetical protein